MTLTTYGGKITALNMQARQITIQDKEGLIHMGRWSEHNTTVQNGMEKLQVGYFKSMSGEVVDDVMKIESIGFFDKEGFPQQNGGKGGWKGNAKSPAEIHSIENQVCMKEAGETFRVLFKDMPETVLHPTEAAKTIAEMYRILRDAMREAPL